MRDIVKCFPGVRANSKVCFDVDTGEIHALLGENGAGKSTLMRQLYGLYQPDEGDIIIDGKRLALRSPADAIKAGIGMIHQHFMLVPTLTVAQNVALGQPSTRAPLLDLKRVAARIAELAEEYGLKVDPQAYVWQLSVGEQQRVEIMKTLYRGARLIILDEPTAVLTPQEVDDLFTTLRRMAREGHSLVFISHKLQEVMAISDRVTVLRDGKVIGTHATKDVTRSELVKMMVGRELSDLQPRPREPGPVLLSVEGLRAMGDRGTEALRGVDLRDPRRRDRGPRGRLGKRAARAGRMPFRHAQVHRGKNPGGKQRHHHGLGKPAREGRPGVHPRGADAGRGHPRLLRPGEPLPPRQVPAPVLARHLPELPQHGRARGTAGGRVCREDAGPRYAR